MRTVKLIQALPAMLPYADGWATRRRHFINYERREISALLTWLMTLTDATVVLHRRTPPNHFEVENLNLTVIVCQNRGSITAMNRTLLVKERAPVNGKTFYYARVTFDLEDAARDKSVAEAITDSKVDPTASGEAPGSHPTTATLV